MPQYIWEGIFSILNVLVPSVVMALFVSYYQNRRKREIQIEGKLAISRIEVYEKILSCLYEGQYLTDISLKEEKEAATIFKYLDIKTFHYQCPNTFMDEASFDAYYERLVRLQKDYQIYLDDNASRQLSKSLGIYTKIKKWMDAFSDTEHTVDLKVKEKVAREHIDWMYRLMGMIMFSHCTRAYAELDMLVCHQMNRLYLTYHKHTIRKWLRTMGDAIIYMFDVNMNRKCLIGSISRGIIQLYIGKEERDFGHIMATAAKVMQYVHFSDSYSPTEFFEGKRVPSREELKLYGQVFMAMLHKS